MVWTLGNCSSQAGYMRNGAGQVTTTRARPQVAVFNALSKASANRRGHDKMLVVDGQFLDLAAVLAGGRNISLDYCGLKQDGGIDPTAFKDIEILLREPGPGARVEPGVGTVAQRYFDLLFLNKGNKFLESDLAYPGEAEKSQEALARLRKLKEFAERYGTMAQSIMDCDMPGAL